MKAKVMKRSYIHIIPLIIFTLLFYEQSSYASTQAHSGKYVSLAKGQAYVPPQKTVKCV